MLHLLHVHTSISLSNEQKTLQSAIWIEVCNIIVVSDRAKTVNVIDGWCPEMEPRYFSLVPGLQRQGCSTFTRLILNSNQWYTNDKLKELTRILADLLLSDRYMNFIYRFFLFHFFKYNTATTWCIAISWVGFLSNYPWAAVVKKSTYSKPYPSTNALWQSPDRAGFQSPCTFWNLVKQFLSERS